MKNDSRVVLYLLIFFSILTMLLVLFYYLCEISYNGVVTENSYEKGLDYNNILRFSDVQKSLNLDYNIDYTQVKGRHYLLCFYAKNTKSNVLMEKVQMKIMRPVTDKYDRNIDTLINGDNNKYCSNVTLDPGQWDIVVTGYYNKNKIFFRKRVILSSIN